MLPDEAILFPKSPVSFSERRNTTLGFAKPPDNIPSPNNLSNPYCEDNIIHVKFVKIHQSSLASNKCISEDTTERTTNEINLETKKEQPIDDP